MRRARAPTAASRHRILAPTRISVVDPQLGRPVLHFPKGADLDATLEFLGYFASYRRDCVAEPAVYFDQWEPSPITIQVTARRRVAEDWGGELRIYLRDIVFDDGTVHSNVLWRIPTADLTNEYEIYKRDFTFPVDMNKPVRSLQLDLGRQEDPPSEAAAGPLWIGANDEATHDENEVDRRAFIRFNPQVPVDDSFFKAELHLMVDEYTRHNQEDPPSPAVGDQFTAPTILAFTIPDYGAEWTEATVWDDFDLDNAWYYDENQSFKEGRYMDYGDLTGAVKLPWKNHVPYRDLTDLMVRIDVTEAVRSWIEDPAMNEGLFLSPYRRASGPWPPTPVGSEPWVLDPPGLVMLSSEYFEGTQKFSEAMVPNLLLYYDEENPRPESKRFPIFDESNLQDVWPLLVTPDDGTGTAEVVVYFEPDAPCGAGAPIRLYTPETDENASIELLTLAGDTLDPWSPLTATQPSACRDHVDWSDLCDCEESASSGEENLYEIVIPYGALQAVGDRNALRLRIPRSTP